MRSMPASRASSRKAVSGYISAQGLWRPAVLISMMVPAVAMASMAGS